MFLKSIVLNGFKSFALRKEVLIQDGITGIVGPNGSGKSNIADAVRWVLGEQSSRSLRGASMQEVIFKGTQTRPAKSSCEVSLLFDNTDHHFDVAYAEVCVKRRMFRSGESEYSINGANCRLKDVVALFRGTGLGKDGYSIIGQGRINRILDSRASERRAVFEEAAGIMKYRVRKEEAERNLQKTNDNITRVDDIIGELSAQVEPLEIQVRDAREYLSLSEELRILDVNLILRSLEQTKARKEKIEQNVQERREALESTSGDKRSVTDARNETKETLKRLRLELEQLQEILNSVQAEKEHAHADLRLAEQKLHSLQDSSSDLHVRLEARKQKFSQEEVRAEELAPQLKDLLAKEEEASRQLAAFREQFAPPPVFEDGEVVRRSIRSIDNELSELSEIAFEAKLQQGISETESERLQKERVSIACQLKDLEKNLQIWKTEGTKADEELRSLESSALEFQGAIQDASKRAAENQRALVETERQISSSEAKAALIEEMQSGFEGYYESVRRLMQDIRQRPVSKDVLGTVGSCIEVESAMETAIETALGNAVQNVIVSDDDIAKELIDILRRQRLGRVTFLPVSSLQIRSLNTEERKALNMPGILGVASEMVRCDAQVRPAIDYLLARTVISEDLDAALALKRQRRNTFRLVTLQGDVVVSGGAITGGSAKRPQVSLLARKRMADELKNTLVRLRERLQQLRHSQQNIENERTSLQGNYEKCTQEIREAQNRISALKERIDRATASKKEFIHQLESIKESIERVEAFLQSFEIEQSKRDERTRTLREELANVQSRLKEIEEEENARQLEDASRAAKAAQMETALAQIHAQVDVKKTEQAHALRVVDETRKELENLGHQIEQIARTTTKTQDDLKGYRIREAEAEEQILSTQNMLDNKQRIIRKEEENLDFLEQQLTGALDRENLQNKEIYKLEADLEKCKSALSTQHEKLWSEYELTLANAESLRQEPFSPKLAAHRLQEIRSRMRELGPINPNAVQEYNRIKERLDALEVQRDDLVKAADDLEIVISKIMKGMKTAFQEKFAAINEAYSNTFKALFGGGSACIELQDDAPVMEAGIEIKAEPPGKKLQNISLLSGGEKALTAIALCFAMLEVNPSPICLLDEIDAPLDDKNVVRLAEYLGKLKSSLQFIVITHKKTTMDACDALYGIAMHEKGVSDLVSVDMSGKEEE